MIRPLPCALGLVLVASCTPTGARVEPTEQGPLSCCESVWSQPCSVSTERLLTAPPDYHLCNVHTIGFLVPFGNLGLLYPSRGEQVDDDRALLIPDLGDLNVPDTSGYVSLEGIFDANLDDTGAPAARLHTFKLRERAVAHTSESAAVHGWD